MVIRTVVVMLSLAGCAFDAGEPWGRLALDLRVGVEVDDGRLDEQGSVKTARDFRVRVDAITVNVESVQVRFAGDPAGPAGVFDPQSPPPRYSLCHNGHCHRDDGVLVAYEDIVAELSGAPASSGASVQWTAGAVTLEALGLVVAVPMGGCSDGCETGRVDFQEVVVTLRSLAVVGHVTDARTGEAARLPDGGVPFSLVSAPLALRVPLSGGFTREGPHALTLRATARFSAAMFDGLEFADGGGTATAVGVDGAAGADALALAAEEAGLEASLLE